MYDYEGRSSEYCQEKDRRILILFGTKGCKVGRAFSCIKQLMIHSNNGSVSVTE